MTIYDEEIPTDPNTPVYRPYIWRYSEGDADSHVREWSKLQDGQSREGLLASIYRSQTQSKMAAIVARAQAETAMRMAEAVMNRRHEVRSNRVSGSASRQVPGSIVPATADQLADIRARESRSQLEYSVRSESVWDAILQAGASAAAGFGGRIR